VAAADIFFREAKSGANSPYPERKPRQAAQVPADIFFDLKCVIEQELAPA
jgi:hypothetical protein